MKKLLLVVAVVLFGFNAQAQEQGQISGFAALTYPLSTGSELGINAGVEYMISGEFAAAPSFSYYFTPSGISSYSINLDARYYFGGNDTLKYYGMAGFNISAGFVTVLSETLSSSIISGINAGAGLIYNLSDGFGLIGQVKYASPGQGAVEPSLGVNFSF